MKMRNMLINAMLGTAIISLSMGTQAGDGMMKKEPMMEKDHSMKGEMMETKTMSEDAMMEKKPMMEKEHSMKGEMMEKKTVSEDAMMEKKPMMEESMMKDEGGMHDKMMKKM